MPAAADGVEAETVKAECRDCGTPYAALGCDLALPDQQWKVIHPEGEGGIASVSGRVSVVVAWIEGLDYAATYILGQET